MKNTHLFKKFILPAIVLLGVFALGGVLGAYAHDFRESRCENPFRFINAEVVCDKSATIKKTGYAGTVGRIETFIAEEKSAGRLTGASVYFRDLANGPVFGINETDDFAPASLLKLPLAFVFLNQAERQPTLLEKKLQFDTAKLDIIQTFPPKKTIETHLSYAVEDLLARMLSYSDNLAYGLLLDYLNEEGKQDVIAQTYLELGFIDPTNISDEVMSTRQYAALFRLLYNSSFLNAKYSEQTLKWLAQSDFTQGLSGGVPKEVTIAHKFGERSTENGEKQLHDCGIIYYPGNPYLLCVMTRGGGFGELAAVIRHISKEVYQEVDSRRL